MKRLLSLILLGSLSLTADSIKLDLYPIEMIHKQGTSKPRLIQLEKYIIGGTVLENEENSSIPVKDVGVKLFIKDKFIRETKTNNRGFFIIPSNSLTVTLCFKKKGYEGNYCLPYQENMKVYLPKIKE